MACKYIFNGIEFKDKDTFVKEYLIPNFINQPKTLRIQEVQQPDFLKEVRNNSNYLSTLGLSKEQEQFLNLLFGKKEQWSSFFVKSLIQNAAKKGYEKVLFPKGNTASKIEGHQTLDAAKERIQQDIDIVKRGGYYSNMLTENSPTQVTNQHEYQGTHLDKMDTYTPSDPSGFTFTKDGNKYESDNFTGEYWFTTPDNKTTFITGEEFAKAQENSDIPKESKEKTLEYLNNKLKFLDKEGFGALRPIYNFYENRVTNILNKLYDVKEITDEYGNKWNEILITPNVLSNIMLQRNEANKIIGQANIEAGTVLIDLINQQVDTLPHEYAHHYIAWFRDTEIVQTAIKKWGSEEALVDAIGKEVVKKKGKAYNWWKRFNRWIKNIFNKLSSKSKEDLVTILSDAFLQRVNLSKVEKLSNRQNSILDMSITDIKKLLTKEERKQFTKLRKQGNLKTKC